MLFLVNLEAFFFKRLAIKFCSSDSERFLMAKNHQKKAMFVVIGAIIIIIIPLMIFPMIDEGIDSEDDKQIRDVGATSTFQTQDIFAFTGIREITVTSKEHKPLNVYIITEEQQANLDLNLRLNQDEDTSFGVTNFSYKDEDFIDQEEYVLYIEVVDDGPANITYGFDRGVSNNVSFALLFFPFLFVIVNFIWMLYLQPLKKRYQKTSIYE
jgi:hypothetical protein